ncbi:aspartic proteinase 3 [[Candida] jaroonii]|uniref:Aspartic proteinase 3 n=1 Tax=[Candida] jaroonii TaxID=467808 RepID=A0ACA9YC06_9ASCO|nr:aspartic proteinase 3 [[Candida] jaroonii]
MKISTLSTLAVLSGIARGDDDFFRLNFGIHRGSNKFDMSPNAKPKFVKRNGFLMEMTNEQTFYLTELEMGSNGDKVGVLVDTGSSDLWVMSHDVACFDVSGSSSSKRSLYQSGLSETIGGISVRDLEERELGIHVGNIKVDSLNETPMPSKTNVKGKDFSGEILSALGISASDAPVINPDSGSGSDFGDSANTCTSYGSFATANSDSFQTNSSASSFQIQYADGTEADGFWAHDDVKIGNTTVNSLSFAVVNETSSNVGVLGIGLPGLETTYSSDTGGRRYQYENLPIKLRNQGVIQKAAYSLYLGDTNSETGTILFGAVDHAKYSGDLVSLPVVNSLESWGYEDPIRLEINVNDIKLNTSGSSTESVTSNGYAALLDTGSTLSYFPQSLLIKLGSMLDLDYSSSLGAYIIDCNVKDDIALTFDFSGVSISVPLKDYVLSASRSTCYFGILPQDSSSDYILLGDNFLRNAYVVYDLDDYTISLAQVKHTDDEDIEQIRSSIPGAKTASGAATSAFTGGSESTATSGISVGGGSSSSSSSGSSSGSSGDSDAESGASFISISPKILFMTFGLLMVSMISL